MPLVDLTVPLSPQTVLYPGDAPPVLTFVRHLGRGDPSTDGRLTTGLHVASHVDAPAHFIPGGDTVDRLAPDRLCGPCSVIDLSGVSEGPITATHLSARRDRLDRPIVLVRTRNGALPSTGPARADYCALSPDAARLLVAAGVTVVGIDYLSVEGMDDPTFPVHKTLLASGVLVLENLRLSDVGEGYGNLCCLPMLIAGAEAAPVRALLRI
jgi:arylformamidase